MRLRRFEAATVTEALARVKADLGPEAVILHARTGDPCGQGGRVEVTAAVDGESKPAGRAVPAPDGQADGASDGYGLSALRPPQPGRPRDSSRPHPAGPTAVSGIRPDGLPFTRPMIGGALPFLDEPDLFEGGDSGGDRVPGVSPGILEEIRQMLLELRVDARPSPRLPTGLRPAYRRLLAQDVPAGAARQLLFALPPAIQASRSGPDPAVLQEVAAQEFRVSGPITPGRQQRAVALVGPTGVGKTTTIAKLAGQFRHGGGLNVALITLDTYRIGAVAQMRIYADLLGVPLHVVRTPAEMRAALHAERGADLVLVDTMGRSPRQPEGIVPIRRLLREVPELEVHLVVSATTKGTDLEEILRRFRPLDFRRVLVTKLDEVRTYGPLLGLALQRQLAISYLSTGQEVPDDLEPATPRRLAALLVPGSLGERRRISAGSSGRCRTDN